jgi:ATP-dependent Lon protease
MGQPPGDKMARSDKDDLISLIEEDGASAEIPTSLPLLPVRDIVIFSDMVLPLFVGREKSIRAVEEGMAKDGFLMLAAQKDPTIENPETDDIYTVGTVGRILRMLKLPDGSVKALVQGSAKAKIKNYLRKRSSYRVKIELVEEKPVEEINLELEALMRTVGENSEKILSLQGEMSGDISTILQSIEEPGKLADLVASNLKLKIQESQTLLELSDPVERLKKVNDLLSRELELSTVQAKIESNVKDEISKSQRDYFLREQVRAIYKELGEHDEKALEIEDYRKKIKRAKMPKEANQEAIKQLKRLEQMHPDSSEATVSRTYLDWLVSMPWRKASKDSFHIQKAKIILDAGHYGLKKVKDRVLEYLSVRKLNPKMKGPILCFVGPPGVGKTSLGQSIARAMQRKFIRISLGGIRDEAEIRGHRRTYIGAMPGRILQGLKQCSSNNPVFMMDEIDKLGADFRGDPSSALLEALDPEQNSVFSDHFLNLPFDLSKVMFILTANLTDTIPPALLDRMEIITLSGYTEEEKMMIAQDYLIPRQVKENGLKARSVSISSGALRQIISEYTSEAGLRNLEREIGTHVGGEVLYVEVSLIGGKGDLIITGQLGDVMQESARAALSYARANRASFGLGEKKFENLDIHIHVPAGAIPKDGPSAGIAMATALISALTNTAVRNDVAMTGEITLRGRVLPIGGLKEKALGAMRAGIRTVIIPEKNRKELAEIPRQLKRKIKFLPVKHMDEVLSHAIMPGKPKGKSKRAKVKRK